MAAGEDFPPGRAVRPARPQADEKIWQLNSVFELNGSYFTDGSNLLYAAPGFQLALERMIVEASLQLPVIRDLKTTVEPDFIFVIGTRITW